MERDVHTTATRGYSRAADVYERARPAYPDAAVDWLLAGLGAPSSVVDVGAGTGKFTAQLVERGVAVLAVEPVAAMRERLAALGSSVTPIDATAEQLPFERGAVEALVAAQSLHWTDVTRALAGFDRVLRPAGAIGLIWNFRDLDVPWQRDLEALLAGQRGSAPHSRDGRWQRAVEASPFAVRASETWRWSLTTDEPGVLDRVRSVSYVAALSEDEQRGVLDRVRAILEHHGVRSSGGAIEFPYVTEAYVLAR